MLSVDGVVFAVDGVVLAVQAVVLHLEASIYCEQRCGCGRLLCGYQVHINNQFLP